MISRNTCKKKKISYSRGDIFNFMSTFYRFLFFLFYKFRCISTYYLAFPPFLSILLQKSLFKIAKFILEIVTVTSYPLSIFNLDALFFEFAMILAKVFVVSLE